MDKLLKNKWVRFYFDPRGRATRYDFNIFYALVAFVGSVIAFGVDYVMYNGDIMAATRSATSVSQIWNYILVVPTFILVARRLHDLNLSGFWQIAAYGVPIGIVVQALTALDDPNILSDAKALQMMIFQCLGAVILILIFFLVLGCKRGTRGANKYGADPLET